MKTLVVLFFLFAVISSIAALPLVYPYYGYGYPTAAYGYSYGYYDPLYSPYTAAYVLPWYKR